VLHVDNLDNFSQFRQFRQHVDNLYTFSVAPSMINVNESLTGVSLYVVSDSKCLVFNKMVFLYPII
jgi:hypothetical protein